MLYAKIMLGGRSARSGVTPFPRGNSSRCTHESARDSPLEFASRLTVRAETRAVARVTLRGIRQKGHVTLLEYSEFWY